MMEIPGTLFIAFAKLLAPIFLNDSDEIPSIKFADFFCILKSASSEFFLFETETTNSFNPSEEDSRDTFISLISFSKTSTFIISFVL